MGELVYVASCSGVIYAFDREDGSVVWSYDTTVEEGQQSTFHGDPLVTDELLVVPGDNGWVYGFALESGELRWKTEVAAPGVFGDVVRAGPLAVGASSRGGLFALELATGARVWSFEPTGPTRGSRGVSALVLGERILYGASDGSVYGLEGATGAMLWRRDFETHLTASLVQIDGQVVAGGANGWLYRLEPTTGEIAAQLELPVVPVGTPVVSGGALVLTDYSSFLLAVESDLGGIRWSQPGRWSSERVLPEGDAVIAGTAEGELAALRPTDGERIWTATLEGHLRGLSKAGDVYYVGTVTGSVYAYRRAPEAATIVSPTG